MKKELEAKLVEKYPKILKDYGGDPMRTCMAWGIECDDGWYDLLDRCMEKLQYFCDLCCKAGVETQVTAHQIKEKYGTLSFYFGGEGGATTAWSIIDDIISEAERMSAQTCEISGASGAACHRGSWYKTLSREEALKLNYKACDKELQAYWDKKNEI